MEDKYHDDQHNEDTRLRSIKKPGHDRAELRAIATYQKTILICILLQIILFFVRYFVPPEFHWALAIPAVLLLISGATCALLLSLKLDRLVIGMLLFFLALIPLVGLLALFVINNTATNKLRANGIHVGFLGANLSDI